MWIVNVFGKLYLIYFIVCVLNYFVDEGVLFERVIEKFFFVVSFVFGGFIMGDEENMVECYFFIVDEILFKIMELLIGDSDFLV